MVSNSQITQLRRTAIEEEEFMLEDSLFASRPSARSKKPATLVLSAIVHGTLAAALIVIPLFQTQVLPHIALFEPLHPPVAARGIELVPAPRAPRAGAPSASTPSTAPQISQLTAPKAIPWDIARLVEQPVSGPLGVPTAGVGGPGFPGGSPFGDPNGVPGGTDSGPLAPPRPPPVAAPPPAPPEPPPNVPVRRGGDVVQSNLIHTVQPVYPRLAIITRSHGAVILEAVITREGAIDPSRLRVLQSANPLLTPAAVEAVKQWRYRPTLLNGQPVEILTTITINFTLN
jgi:protein TonB